MSYLVPFAVVVAVALAIMSLRLMACVGNQKTQQIGCIAFFVPASMITFMGCEWLANRLPHGEFTMVEEVMVAIVMFLALYSTLRDFLPGSLVLRRFVIGTFPLAIIFRGLWHGGGMSLVWQWAPAMMLPWVIWLACGSRVRRISS